MTCRVGGWRSCGASRSSRQRADTPEARPLALGRHGIVAKPDTAAISAPASDLV